MEVTPHGLEAVSDVAERSGVSTRCMRRRLQRLAARLAVEHPGESPLLHRLVEGGGPGRTDGKDARWYLDRAVAYRHARGLVGPGSEDPWAHVVRVLSDWRDEERARLERIEERLEQVANMVALRAG